MLRRLVVILACCAVALAATLVSAPWWLGAVGRWIGPTFGVTFEHYERVGYARFRVRGLQVYHEPVRVKVDQVEADTPFVWLWRKWTSEPGEVVAGKWSTDVSHSQKSPSSRASGWRPLQRRLGLISRYLSEWVPRARAGAGVVTWPNGGLSFKSVQWNGPTLTTPDIAYRSLHAAVKAEFPGEEIIRANATTLDGAGSLELNSHAGELAGSLTWWNQPAPLKAQFDEAGWLPREATMRAEHWEIAGDRVKLGSAYASIAGDGWIEWKAGQLSTDISVEGKPREKSAAPPLTVKLRGHGTNDAFVADALNVVLPGVQAHLEAPIAIDPGGRLHSESSAFVLEADLAQMPWLHARGALHGRGGVTAAHDGRARVTFTLAGEGISVFETDVAEFHADGEWLWPALAIKNLSVRTVDGSDFSASGGWDFRQREVRDAVLQGRVERTLLARWLPEYPKFNSVEIRAKAAGPWQKLSHQGRARVGDLLLKKMQPLEVTVDWNGVGPTASRLAAVVRAAETTITADGSVDRDKVVVKSLVFSEGDNERLHLSKPVQVGLSRPWSVGDFELTGRTAMMRGSFAAGPPGQLQVVARHLESDWFRSLIVLPPTKWRVDDLNAEAHWTDGPATFSLATAITVDVAENRSAEISAQMKGSDDGVEITSLRVAEGGSVIVNAAGHVPVMIRPAQDERWVVSEQAPFSINAATSPNPAFWEKVTQLTGVEIVQPEMTLHFDGTLSQPRGEARVKAARLAPLAGRFKGVWPKIEGLDLHVVGDKEGLSIEQFVVEIEGQQVKVSGRLPDAASQWRDLIRNPREVAQRGELHLEIPDAEIAAFVHYFPEYIAPKGRFDVDLTIQGEKSVTGFIRLREATSRPLGPLGVLQEITADIRFSGRTANFEAVTARMGGQLVTLKGTAQLPPNKEPRLDLALTGENLPFVRKAGLLVRGDLDLKLTTPEGAPPAIHGEVHMRDSLFLADIRSLLPSGAKGVAARPPYFSVETPPLDKWTVDVTVRGERFLRLRTPVFNGTASARFNLDGTLGEPRIAGEAVVNQGNIRLPFANFEVQQGEVRLSAGQLQPQIFLTATTRRFGYDLRMELTGDTQAPNLTFSSSPPLEAEQVLLMVMAGEAPRNEVSTTDRQRVARFGAFFGQSLLGSFGGDPSGPDRLTISSGSDISEQGRETYSIEYRLNDRWALTGEYDEFDDYYGGLKWRIYPKGDVKRDEKK